MGPSNGSRKPRIAILGGGPSGLAAAYELTRYPGWQERYEVVVYQLGWRLGGKCATGRGPNGRVEEHGIHILQGWYHNTFRMLRQLYDERRERGIAPDSPFQHWREAFDTTNSTLLTEYRADQARWLTRAVTLPGNRKIPGEAPDSTWVAIQDILRQVLAAVMDTVQHLRELRLPAWLGRELLADDADPRAADSADRVRRALFELLDRWRESRASAMAVTWAERVLRILGKLVRWVERCLQRFSSESLRWYLILLDLAHTHLKGILADVFDPRTGTFDYEAINHLDYRAWLARHGAREMTRYSSIVRFAYAGTYAYINDGGQDGGLLAAGSVVRAMIAALSYRDSLVWFFKAGTGDTMIMPLYQVLAARGVEFRFFHRVRAIHWSDTGDIEQVTVGRQVTLKNGSYDPALRLPVDPAGQPGGGQADQPGGGPGGAGHVLDAWPSRPLQAQIQEDVSRAELESPWSAWQDAATQTLRKGEDFDQLVLAIPVAALPDICGEIIARDTRWRDMVTHVETTATHSFQLWLRPTLKELGMNPRDWGLPADVVGTNTVTYAHMGKSWTDMTPVLDYEQWPAAHRPGTLLYLTGALPDEDAPGYDDHGFVERQRTRVMYLAEQWLQDHMGYFFPAGSRRGHPGGLDLGLLVDWERPDGPPRLCSQYFRANVDPGERYTLAKPYPRKYRLRTDDAGFDNLFLAGDWIDYGLNMGFFEGAITSGLQAAQAVMRRCYGFIAYEPILGEQDVRQPDPT